MLAFIRYQGIAVRGNDFSLYDTSGARAKFFRITTKTTALWKATCGANARTTAALHVTVNTVVTLP